jgi:hypothetical protein
LTRIALAVGLLAGLPLSHASDLTWVGPNASSWEIAANWDAGLPVGSSDVLLGTYDTTIGSAAFVIQSFSGTGTLSLTGGSLSISAPSSTGGLALSGGSLTGSNTVNAGTFSWNGGTIGTSGAPGPGVTLNVSGPSSFDGYSYNKLIAGGSTLNLNGNTTWYAGYNNAGISLQGPSAPGATASTLNIASGTTFDDQGNNSRSIGSSGYAGGVVNNAGTYAKTGGGTTY